MYHSQDRHVNVPEDRDSRARAAAPTTRSRGSRSSRRHLIGGYAQLSYGFNYYGPTGPQRDELTVVRKRRSEVEY